MPPTSGPIEIDGAPLNARSMASYRERIGCVLQDDRLFAGSIAENIACFDPALALTYVRQCVAAAGIDHDVMRMAMGYETLVGDMGSTLSGGRSSASSSPARSIGGRSCSCWTSRPTTSTSAPSTSFCRF